MLPLSVGSIRCHKKISLYTRIETDINLTDLYDVIKVAQKGATFTCVKLLFYVIGKVYFIEFYHVLDRTTHDDVQTFVVYLKFKIYLNIQVRKAVKSHFF